MVTAADNARRRLASAVAVGLVAPLAASPAWGQAVDLGYGVTVGQTYTDNVNLTNDNEDDEWVTSVSPQFDLLKDSGRVQADISYTFQALFYANDDDRDQQYHELDARTTTFLVGESVFLEADASASQAIVDPGESFSNNNISGAQNRTDQTAWLVAPNVERELGIGDLLVRYEHAEINYDDSDVQDTQARSFDFTLDGPRPDSGLWWETAVEYERVEFDVSREAEFQDGYLRLGYQLEPGSSLWAQGGYESNYEDISEAGFEEPYWEVGVELEPGARQRFEANYGQRDYGDTYGLTYEYSVAKGEIRVSYTEQATTTARDFLNRRLRAPDDNIDDTLDPAGAPEVFVLKRLVARANWDTGRTRFNVRVYSDERSDRQFSEVPPDDDQRLRGEESWGGNAGIRWQAGRRTSIGTSAEFTRRKFERTDREDDLIQLAANIAYQLGRRTALGLVYEYTEQDADEGSGGYTENRVTLTASWYLAD